MKDRVLTDEDDGQLFRVRVLNKGEERMPANRGHSPAEGSSALGALAP